MSSDKAKVAMSPLLIKHMSYECPVDRKLHVRPMSMGEFLCGTPERIVIPIFQRRYCWKRSQIELWWKDILHANGDLMVGHRIGKLLFARSGSVLLCIDGQQRLTTTFLFLASIRDALLEIAELSANTSSAGDLINRIESILYFPSSPTSGDPDLLSLVKLDCEAFRSSDDDSQYQIPEGTVLSCLRLTPSYPDRASFIHLITDGRMCPNHSSRLSSPSSGNAAIMEHCLIDTKTFFDERVRAYLQAKKSAPVEAMKFLVDRTLNFFSIMYTECMQGVDLPQLFLWTQEKTLFGMGTLLYNPTPGLPFAMSDLVRNLVLSTLAGRSQQEQEEFYNTNWIPLQTRFASSAEFDVFLSEFVDSKNDNNTYIPANDEDKSLENAVIQIMTFLRLPGTKRQAILRYARFVSYFKNQAKQMQGHITDLPYVLLKELAELKRVQDDSPAGDNPTKSLINTDRAKQQRALPKAS